MFYRWGRVAFRHRRVIPLVVIAIILVMQVLFGAKPVSYTHLTLPTICSV